MASPTVPEFEKLGAFYLGREYDLASRTRGERGVLYDSRDLVTHAVCVGMTGSGKTGLCLSILEEAAIDGIPAVVIDPKGDLANLLLTFPNLRPEDFRPWVNEDDAKRKGLDPDTFAAQQAELWKKGLAEWGQDGARIQRFRDAAECVVYTPGSSAGIGVSVLRSFEAPGPEVVENAEMFRERVAVTVASVLGLLGIEADPMRSREHLLLSALFARAWEAGESLGLEALVAQVQSPPVSRLGVMELESVFPSKERFELAMQINTLIASPGFARWAEGEPLDLAQMLYTPGGKARIAIFSIAHLSDAERMFFVSLLLNQTLGWVRAQTGTTSLRAIVYMDEIAGYFPPVANPPSKQPLLTLMKQARAFGVGVMLATQNPVDLDYKGLANAGTWFIGRLQTDRDKQRVLDGLEGASSTAGSTFDRSAADKALSALGSRVFLMNNVHEDGPVVFETRWALSYLRGPLTRAQIKTLMDPLRPGAPAASAPTTRASTPGEAPAGSSTRPVLPAEIPQYFLPARSAGKVTYRPMLFASARIYYADTKSGLNVEDPAAYLVPMGEGPVPVDWDHAQSVELEEKDLEKSPASGAEFAPLLPEAARVKSYDAWKKAFADMLFRERTLEIFMAPAFKAYSEHGESERDFSVRLAQMAREKRDAGAEKLRQKYGARLATLQDRIRRAEQAVEVQREQARSAKMQTAVSFGSALLSAFTGRKTMSAGNISKAATAAKGIGRSSKESADVGRATENVEALKAQFAELDREFCEEVNEVTREFDAMTEKVEKVSIKPKKTGITVRAVVLAWAPHEPDGSGGWRPAW